MDDFTNISIVDRRARKSNEKVLKQLSDSMAGITDTWNYYVKSITTSQDSAEHLASIMVTLDFIKNLCLNKSLFFISSPIEVLEAVMDDLIGIPDSKELQEKITLQIHNLADTIDNFTKEFLDNKILSGSNEEEEEIVTEIAIPLPVSTKKVFIVSDEEKFIEECSLQVGYYGYATMAFRSFDAFLVGLSQTTPAAIIADLDLFKDEESHTHSLKEYSSKSSHIPMIMVSNKGDFESRLKSVQAGSIAFFTKPVNITLLLDKLDSIINSSIITDPSKVLVIDDSKTVSEFLKRTLTKAGMIVHVETNAEAGLAAIPSFNPDLILMDIYMPICDGEDLCRIIRQSEFFTSIPIVFLSSETDIQKQLSAMKIGADDFLTKDIDAQHLLTSISIRIQRHRVLSSFMIRDSLTGLLNHTTSKKQLDQMIIKSKNLKLPLVFAMIDIDHFKKVNDNYGHPTGDRVIKSLSRLLQKRLRKNDCIGRYGGEEFAVVLWDTNIENAQKILNQLRDDFSKIEHIHEGKIFYTTFSAGVADFPNYQDGFSISNAADKALYVAKNNGRNKVCTYIEPVPLIENVPTENKEDK